MENCSSCKDLYNWIRLSVCHLIGDQYFPIESDLGVFQYCILKLDFKNELYFTFYPSRSGNYTFISPALQVASVLPSLPSYAWINHKLNILPHLIQFIHMVCHVCIQCHSILQKWILCILFPLWTENRIKPFQKEAIELLYIKKKTRSQRTLCWNIRFRDARHILIFFAQRLLRNWESINLTSFCELANKTFFSPDMFFLLLIVLHCSTPYYIQTQYFFMILMILEWHQMYCRRHGWILGIVMSHRHK